MEDTIMAEQQKQMYQWIKGDNFGKVVTVSENQQGDEFLYFEDGTRINKDFIQEYMMPVKNEREVLKVAEDVQTPQTTQVQNEVPVTVDNTTAPAPVEENTPEPTVMGKMIMKMSKKNVVNVPIQINVNIPTPALYAMLSEGMEEEDLNEEIMAVALQQIEINNLTEYLKENISEFLSEYYS